MAKENVDEQNFRVVDSLAAAEVVSHLAHVIWIECYKPILGIEQINYMLDMFQAPNVIMEDIETKGYQYYLILDDNEAIGYIAFKFEPEKRTVLLSKIYVLQNYRGRGFGALAIEFIKSLALSKGCESIWLTVNKHNPRSIAAYDALGFRTIKSIVTDIGNGFVMDDYLMRKEF